MIIGERLRDLRHAKNLSQGDIEKRTGLLRCYLSRVENGHTVPAIETLEKIARAIDVPLYQIFYDEAGAPKAPDFAIARKENRMHWGSSGKDALVLRRFRLLFSHTSEADRNFLLSIAGRMAQNKRAGERDADAFDKNHTSRRRR